MAQACIDNVNGRGVLLARKLVGEGRIDDFFQRGSLVCLVFNRQVEISLDDYAVFFSTDNVEREPGRSIIREQFRTHIIGRILSTLEDARVPLLDEDRIVIEPAGKSSVVCFRIADWERRMLEEEAEKKGKTLSDLIREKLFQGEQA